MVVDCLLVINTFKDDTPFQTRPTSQSFVYLTLGLVAKDFQRLLELSGVTNSLRAVASLLQRLWCGGPQTFVVRPKLGFCVFRIYVEPIEKK